MFLFTLRVSMKRPMLADAVLFISTMPCTLPGWHIPNLKESRDKYSHWLYWDDLLIIFAPAPSPSPTTLGILRWSRTVTKFNPRSCILGKVKSWWRSSAPGSWPGRATWTNRALRMHDSTIQSIYLRIPLLNLLHGGVHNPVHPAIIGWPNIMDSQEHCSISLLL